MLICAGSPAFVTRPLPLLINVVLSASLSVDTLPLAPSPPHRLHDVIPADFRGRTHTVPTLRKGAKVDVRLRRVLFLILPYRSTLPFVSLPEHTHRRT